MAEFIKENNDLEKPTVKITKNSMEFKNLNIKPCAVCGGLFRHKEDCSPELENEFHRVNEKPISVLSDETFNLHTL